MTGRQPGLSEPAVRVTADRPGERPAPSRHIAMSARVVIERVPPSLNDVLGQHWSVIRRIKDELTMTNPRMGNVAHLLALAARAKAGWPAPAKDGGVRWVEFRIYRKRLLDDDNPFVKPLLDSLIGALVWDDAPAYCALVDKPQQVLEPLQERTEITVWLVDPRRSE